MAVRSIAAGLSLTLLCSCTTVQRFEPQAADNQKCQMVNRNKICTSKQPDSTVMISIKKPIDGYLPLLILIANESSGPFDVIPTDIELLCKNDNNNYCSPIKVYGPRELEAKIKLKQGWEKAHLAVGQAKRANGSDNADRSAVYLRDYAEKSDLTQKQTMESAGFLDGLLRETTLYPGQYATGIVWAEFKNVDTYLVIIKINNDVHTVEFIRIGK